MLGEALGETLGDALGDAVGGGTSGGDRGGDGGGSGGGNGGGADGGLMRQHVCWPDACSTVNLAHSPFAQLPPTAFVAHVGHGHVSAHGRHEPPADEQQQ